MSDDILTPERVVLEHRTPTREEAIRDVGRLLVEAGAVRPGYVDSMLAREATVSTSMGNFLAIPHGTNEGREFIDRTALAVIRYPSAIEWDGDEVRFVIGIAGRENEHLEILGRIAVLFSDDDDVQSLLAAPTAEALYALISAVNED
ncbi:PTS sugar transporter subunit IIA [Protaetiibacter intestinalis]|uniref:Mannitol-specific phosphotransferase enzyme IIA component n=1 Tax=Protaetiibacter intestinalis TaxID=2419774 RepID=A0A387B717_9MICO|nr:PTS sugar transporter subunit IIA [Protaetiibacter intestinalis]AYF97538.1 PTS mannitol transporter subunit IIA [Protaetiibacter intestinalis]